MSWDFSDVQSTALTLTAGEYAATVKEAKVKETKSGGEMITLKWVTDQNQVVYQNYNVRNDNKTAENIGKGQIKSILTVCGKSADKLHDVKELEGLKCTIKVAMKYDDYSQQERPNITSYSAIKEEAQSTSSSPFA